MDEELLGKDKDGRDIYWNPDKFCETGLCNHCKYERGKCPNEYCDETTSDPFICDWFEPNKD